MADYLSGLSGLANLYGQYQSYQNASDGANTINGISNTANSAYQTQLQSLQNQGLSANQMRDQQWATSAHDAQYFQNGTLMNQIGNMEGQLNSLTDPNSAYMQQARQAIERKDAAAGRRSQWGEREVQLAGNLAQQYNQYAPGLQNSITAANNQIMTNNQGLANIYNTYSTPIKDLNTQMTSLVNEGGKNQVQLAQAAMAANNGANNQQNSLLGSAFSALPGAIKGATSLWDNLFGDSGSTGNTDALGDFGSSEGWW